MKFAKIRMIWGIIRNRGVMYNMTVDNGVVKVTDNKTCIVNCTFKSCGVDAGDISYGDIKVFEHKEE